VGADAAIAVAVKPGGIAAPSTIALASDEVDEFFVDGTRLQAIFAPSMAAGRR
jgi:hypothetical protein